jgi:hypothetical protein
VSPDVKVGRLSPSAWVAKSSRAPLAGVISSSFVRCPNSCISNRELTVVIDHSIVALGESSRSCKRGKKERDKSVELHPEAKGWYSLVFS